VWSVEGYNTLPEMTNASVVSLNPGRGLYTRFVFTFRSISGIPPGGLITITAPQTDYYFGPQLPNDIMLTADPLESIPPPAGASPVRPPPTQPVACTVLDPLLGINGPPLTQYSACTSWGGYMEVVLSSTTTIAPGTLVAFSVTGYNTNSTEPVGVNTETLVQGGTSSLITFSMLSTPLNTGVATGAGASGNFLWKFSTIRILAAREVIDRSARVTCSMMQGG
jgi:hypothetical protein